MLLFYIIVLIIGIAVGALTGITGSSGVLVVVPVVLNLYNNFSVYKDKIREIIDVIAYELHRR